METLDKDPGEAVRTILKAHGARSQANRGSIFKRSFTLWLLVLGVVLIASGGVVLAIGGLRAEVPSDPFTTSTVLNDISRILRWMIVAGCTLCGVLSIAAGVKIEWFPGDFGILDWKQTTPDALLEEIAQSGDVPVEIKHHLSAILVKKGSLTYGDLLQSAAPLRDAARERAKAQRRSRSENNQAFRKWSPFFRWIASQNLRLSEVPMTKHDHIPLGELSDGDMEAFTASLNETLNDRRVWVAQAMNYFEVFVALATQFLKLVPIVWFWLIAGLFLMYESGAVPAPPPIQWPLNATESAFGLSLWLACLVTLLQMAASMSPARWRALGLRNIRGEILSERIQTFLLNRAEH